MPGDLSNDGGSSLPGLSGPRGAACAPSRPALPWLSVLSGGRVVVAASEGQPSF